VPRPARRRSSPIAAGRPPSYGPAHPDRRPATDDAAAYADIGGVVGDDDTERDVSGWFVGLALRGLAGSFSLL
jgi:hypothetical protein